MSMANVCRKRLNEKRKLNNQPVINEIMSQWRRKREMALWALSLQRKYSMAYGIRLANGGKAAAAESYHGEKKGS